MSLELSFTQQFRVTETVEDAFTDTAQDTIRKELEQILELDSGTTPDVEDYAIFAVTLSSGTGSINLAALLHLVGAATISKNATGKKVRALAFKTPLANTANMTISKGASNGYAPLGSTYERILAPDTMEAQYFKAAAADVASGARVFDLAGGTTDVLYVAVAWG